MKKLSLCFVVLVLGAGMARAQLLEGAALIGGYLINKEIARGERKEFSAGKINFNVYLEDGTPLSGWDQSNGIAMAWSPKFPVILEPVLIVNSSGSPREVEWATSSVNGPMQKIQFNPVSGGKRGRDGAAKDNKGYKYPVVRFYTRDLPHGWIAISASWGKGQSATATFQNLDVGELAANCTREDVRGALAGAGTGTQPAMPIFIVRMPDGSIRNFLSVTEMNMALSQKRSDPSVGSPQGDNPASPSTQPIADKPQGGLKIWSGYYDQTEIRKRPKREVLSELADKLVKSNPIPDGYNEPIPIPDGTGLAVLAISDKKFSASLVDGEGKVLSQFNVIESGKLYSVLIPLIFANGDGGNSLIFEQGENDQNPRQISFRRGK